MFHVEHCLLLPLTAEERFPENKQQKLGTGKFAPGCSKEIHFLENEIPFPSSSSPSS